MFSSNMKVFLILSSFFLAAQAAVSYEDIILKEWALFKAEHGKSYANQDEDARRMQIFLENKLFVAEHNAKFLRGETTYDVELNKFADMLPEETNPLHGLSEEERLSMKEQFTRPHFEKSDMDPPLNETIPKEKNWVTAGVVTDVKDQRNCSAGYAFAAVGALESHSVIAKKMKLQSLSAQNIIDCSERQMNSGCHGGLPHYAIQYIEYMNGINTEADYPYEAKTELCRFNRDKNAALCKGHVRVWNEGHMGKVLAWKGPAYGRIDASPRGFQMYKSGVFSDPDCTTWFMTHAVYVVGYGVDPTTKKEYWLVKNSWGTNWGEKGYMKLARNAGNMCGIASWAGYPDV